MTTITINDEGERRALEAVLWHEMRPILDPNDMSPVGNALCDAADAVVRHAGHADLSAASAEIGDMISALLALRDEIDRLHALQLGDAIDLRVSKDALVWRLDYVKGSIEEGGSDHGDGGFWNQEPAVREQLLRSRDGAARLLAGLRTEAVA